MSHISYPVLAKVTILDDELLEEALSKATTLYADIQVTDLIPYVEKMIIF